MKEKKPIVVKNYAAIIPAENGERKYKVVNDGNGVEIGIEVKGMLTKFGETNVNGMLFDKSSYDKCVSEYFEKNDLNIPVDIQHVRDAQHLAGVARKFVKKQGGIEITAFIPKGVYFYNLIKVLLDNGVLQGFSNYGYLTDWDWEETVDANGKRGETLTVKEFQLISASLVDVPADVNSKFVSNSTSFEGFPTKTKKKEKDIYNLLFSD